MLPPQAGASRCCLDFLFHSAVRGGPTSSIPLQASRLAESCFALARQVSLWDAEQLEMILDMDFLFFLTPASSIDSNMTFVKTTEVNLSTFCAPAALAGITVKSFCTSSLEGHMRISPEKKNRTTCCYLISFLVRRGAHSFTSLGRICWIQPISSLLKIYSSSSQNEETAGVPADANSSCEAAHSNSVTTSHSGAADEFLSFGFVYFFFCLCVLLPHLPAQHCARKHSAVFVCLFF